MRQSAEQEVFPKSADDRFIEALVDENVELHHLVRDMIDEMESSRDVDDGHMYFFIDMPEGQRQLVQSIRASA